MKIKSNETKYTIFLELYSNEYNKE